MDQENLTPASTSEPKPVFKADAVGPLLDLLAELIAREWRKRSVNLDETSRDAGGTIPKVSKKRRKTRGKEPPLDS